MSTPSAKAFKINIIKHYKGYNPSDSQGSNNFYASGRIHQLGAVQYQPVHTTGYDSAGKIEICKDSMIYR